MSFTCLQINRRNGLTSAILRIHNVVFLVETPCGLVDIYWCFGGTFCPLPYPKRCEELQIRFVSPLSGDL